jgi:hypothetical protein
MFFFGVGGVGMYATLQSANKNRFGYLCARTGSTLLKIFSLNFMLKL